MANLAYIRVSTVEQNEARQIKMMEDLGISKDNMLIDKITGVTPWNERPALSKCIEYMRKGDTLYIESITRLGRSVQEILTVIDILNKKEVGLVSLKENIDTSTPAGRLVLTVMAGVAQWEREALKERQMEGIAIAKALGKFNGRAPKKLENFIEIYHDWLDKKVTAAEASRKLGVARSTFYRKVDDYVKYLETIREE